MRKSKSIRAVKQKRENRHQERRRVENAKPSPARERRSKAIHGTIEKCERGDQNGCTEVLAHLPEGRQKRREPIR
jgi:hypothetical protein